MVATLTRACRSSAPTGHPSRYRPADGHLVRLNDILRPKSRRIGPRQGIANYKPPGHDALV